MNDAQVKDTKETSPGRPVRGNILVAFAWGILILILYVMFNFLGVLFLSPREEFLLKTTWSDASVIAASFLYVSMAGLVFTGAGMLLAWRNRGAVWVWVAAVSSVAVIACVIWLSLYLSLRGSTSELDSLTWLPFAVYIYWAAPVKELLSSYIADTNAVKLIGLLLSLVPTCGAWLGIWIVQRFGARLTIGRLFAGCASIPAAAACVLILSLLMPRQASMTLQQFPKIDGATAAIPFAQIMLTRLTGVNRPYAEREGIRFNTTHQAYENLIGKKADLILVAGPSGEEERLAQEQGVKLKLTPIGKDAFIFLLHRSNPIDRLSTEQIRDIYAGRITNWRQAGGEDQQIIAFQREANSGSQTYMETKVMKGLTLAEPPTERKAGGMGGLIDAVADYRNSRQAIGFSFYYFASSMYRREEVKFVAVDGIEPSQANIRNGQYPYTALLYAVTREDEPASGPAGRLLAWLQSGEGSRAIQDGGFVPLEEK
ncbi:phosphate transport system substrate-binding protein [Paenibacillus sp. UNCCL117]|uniref:PstS family phosphate ABC transporter substrate-binding protein n=1 Tax=unclassified Paenibacillus TaxID=185978 RepID=UPI00088E789B|nr:MULTISPECIES: substrate-binding domain-containing protein [unclassified Paenibacillus]SDC92141.1 phosphate transport system substrate-binding protein [Paenibacillus sp. cl123]SFW29263.1 phosphate transport system substrate-binding protein [Paenibacillus sp. UNCCL117]